MNSRTDQELLRDFARRGAEKVFTELVRRHVNLVYSAALRMVRDTHLAEDVTQSVFATLAQNANKLADCPVLAGWLHRTTRNLASKTVRADVRRRSREQEAAPMNDLLSEEPDARWEEIAPDLDAALDELSGSDRDAILLRYFEQKSAREMSATLGISDEAAQKRVNRAVERLRGFFAKRGVTIGASGLTAIVSANAVQAAPVGLVTTISTATALSGTALAASAITTTTKAAAMTTFQKTAATVALAAVVGTPLAVQQNTLKDLRGENEYLMQLTAQMDELQAERDSLAYRDSLAREFARLQENHEEILRLREETALLNSAEIAEKIRLNQRLNTLQQELAGVSEEAELLANAGRIRIETINEMKRLVGQTLMFRFQREGQNTFPGSFDEMVESGELDKESYELSKYEFFRHEIPVQATQPQAIPFREKEPRLLPSGEWTRIYALVMGTLIEATSPTSDFSEWELQQMSLPEAQPPTPRDR